MMGFYPDCPGDPSYTLTTPRFDRIEITLDPKYCGGRDRLVITKGRHMKGRISHADLLTGKPGGKPATKPGGKTAE